MLKEPGAVILMSVFICNADGYDVAFPFNEGGTCEDPMSLKIIDLMYCEVENAICRMWYF